MSEGKSISSLLEETLGLIGAEGNAGPSSGEKISASKLLINERIRTKRTIESEDFIRFEPNKKKTLETPIISQISNSSVDGPKYWKTNAPTVAKREIKKMKFASGRTNQNRANKKMHAKGEAYKDKYSAKQKGVDQKNNLRKFLKS